MAFGDLAIDAVLVVCAVGGERGDGTVDLIKQGADLRAVIDIVGGQRRRDDLAGGGIHTDVQFAPRPAPARAVLLDQPLAGTGRASARCCPPTDVRVRRWTAVAPRPTSRLAGSASNGRYGEIETEQADDGSDQSFGLPQR